MTNPFRGFSFFLNLLVLNLCNEALFNSLSAIGIDTDLAISENKVIEKGVPFSVHH